MGISVGIAAIANFASTYGAAIAAASAVAATATTYVSTKNQAKAQEEYNKGLEAEAIRQYGELDKAEADAIYKSHQDSMEAQKQHMVARSSMMLESAATGTYGSSLDVALADLNTGFGQRLGEITYARDFELDSINRTAEGIRQSAISGSDRTVRKPAYLAAAGAGISTFARTYGMTKQVGKVAEQAQPGRTYKS